MSAGDPLGSYGRGLRRCIAVYFVVQTAINIGTWPLFHDMITSRLIERYAALGQTGNAVGNAADAAFNVGVAAAVAYGAIQIVLAVLSWRSSSVLVYVADAVWLVTLAIFGLVAVVGFRPGHALGPDARIYVAAMLAVVALLFTASIITLSLTNRHPRTA